MDDEFAMDLDEFLLARIAEDRHTAIDAAAARAREEWRAPALSAGLPEDAAAEHAARFDPDRVLAECAAKRRVVLACREARPDLHFLGVRPRGMANFQITATDQHQLAALTLALLALPYADHRFYREEWRP